MGKFTELLASMRELKRLADEGNWDSVKQNLQADTSSAIQQQEIDVNGLTESDILDLQAVRELHAELTAFAEHHHHSIKSELVQLAQSDKASRAYRNDYK
jgi:hypothetical protein